MAAILLVLLYRLIFVFSGQDGEESGSLSAMISEKCAELLNAISGKHWTQNVLDSMAAYFEHPIRKLAHFSEYRRPVIHSSIFFKRLHRRLGLL